MSRRLQVLVVGTGVAVVTLVGLFLLTPGPDLTMEGPGHWSDWLWLPLLIGAFSCGAWLPGILLHWLLCVAMVAIGFALKYGIRGRRPDPPPVVKPEPDDWTPPTAEDFARAFRKDGAQPNE